VLAGSPIREPVDAIADRFDAVVTMAAGNAHAGRTGQTSINTAIAVLGGGERKAFVPIDPAVCAPSKRCRANRRFVATSLKFAIVVGN
jgi:hypothetical protein